MKMKKFTGDGFTTIVTNDKIKIELPISGLVCGFNQDPYNDGDYTVRRGKYKAFAEWVAQNLLDDADSETGNNFIATMFGSLFEQVFDGDRYVEEYVKFNDTDND
jgi:hypothetical protein